MGWNFTSFLPVHVPSLNCKEADVCCSDRLYKKKGSCTKNNFFLQISFNLVIHWDGWLNQFLFWALFMCESTFLSRKVAHKLHLQLSNCNVVALLLKVRSIHLSWLLTSTFWCTDKRSKRGFRASWLFFSELLRPLGYALSSLTMHSCAIHYTFSLDSVEAILGRSFRLFSTEPKLWRLEC